MAGFNCTIGRYRYQKDDFGIATVYMENGERAVIKGEFACLSQGTEFHVNGHWETHPKYGKQFAVEGWDVPFDEENDLNGIKGFLTSDSIPFVGASTAEKIIDKFGDETPDIISNHPEKLAEIPGITKKRAELISEAWKEKYDTGFAKVQRFFASHNFTKMGYVRRIYRKYGSATITKMKQNPYQAIADVDGIGFSTADAIAEALGTEKTSPERIKAGLEYTLQNAAETEGHVYLTKSELYKRAEKILKIPADQKMDQAVTDMKIESKIIHTNEMIYLRKYHDEEMSFAKNCIRVRNAFSRKNALTDDDIRDAEKAASKGGADIRYDEQQRNAIRMACTEGFSVITGGPGVGKTTIIRAVIHILGKEVKKSEFLLAAPTGKAAKRMKEASGHDAKTIHRLLKWENGVFAYDADNQLEGKVLIVDEASMIDVSLACSLMQAVPDGMRVIFVGDVDQLPPVGPGNVLRDLIDSGSIPVTKLNCIHRQAQQSGIIVNAHRINSGMPVSQNIYKDFMVIVREGQQAIADAIVDLATNFLPQRMMFSSENIQVLCPMRKGDAGVNAINERLQDILNRKGKKINMGNGKLRTGDRVMQTRNNYGIKVFNGEVGMISGYDEGIVTAVYPGDDGKDHEVEYDADSVNEMSLSYATTIHKSQGSEYECVIIPVTMGNWIMLKRNLLYTGVTRAKKMCILVGEPKAINRCINNEQSSKRNTNLKALLRSISAKSSERSVENAPVPAEKPVEKPQKSQKDEIEESRNIETQKTEKLEKVEKAEKADQEETEKKEKKTEGGATSEQP